MPAGLRHVSGVAAVAILVALAVPVGALASGGSKCKASACQVYTEGAPTASGQHAGPTPGQSTTPTKPLPVPSKTARLLQHAGKDRAALARIISSPDYGAARSLKGTGAAATVVGPSLLGAALDLGVGPTVLLAILLAIALALVLHGGVRGWRRRRATAA